MSRVLSLQVKNDRQPHVVLFAEGADQAMEAERLMRSVGDKVMNVVALDPEAEYALERRGIAYAIPDDYCNEADLNEAGIGNFKKVERFCQYADQWLIDRCDPIKAFRLKPAWYNYFALKRLFDLMTVRLLFLDTILRKERPGEVWYFSGEEAGRFDHNLFFEESVYPDLIPLVCSSLQIFSIKLDHPRSRTSHPRVGLPFRRPVPWERWWGIVRTLVGRPVGFACAWRKRWREPEAAAVLIDDLGADDILLVASELVKHTGWRLLNWRPGKDLVIGLCPPALSRVDGKKERDALLAGLFVKAEELWRELSQDHVFRSYLAWNGVQFRNVLESRLRYVFTTLLVEIVARYMAAKAVVKHFKPVLILFSQIVHYWQHAMAAAAREAGIPVVGYQHGAFGERLAPILYYTECREPDYILVYGEGVKSFIERTYQKAAVPIAVGSPRLDRLSRLQTNRKVLCRRWGLDPNRRIVAYCPTFVYGNKLYVSYGYPRSDSCYFQVQRRIVEVFREFPSIQLVVKEHSETSESFPLQQFVHEQGMTNCLFKKEAPFDELLSLADSFILDSPTTTFLEILTTDKPVLVFNNWFHWNEDALALLRERAEFSQDLDEFVNILHKHLQKDWAEYGEPVSDAFLKGFGRHLGDGRSAERAVEALKNIINQAVFQTTLGTD